jgi:histidine triad (HIT) family protein
VGGPIDPDCVFCRIVSGDAEATVVYQDEAVVVFLDTGPVTPGHLMVVPRAHLSALADVDESTGAMFNIAQQMAAALRSSGLRCDGVNLFYADGEAAFQEVLHAHLHVVPRYHGDGFRIDAGWSRPTRAELERVGGQIRAAMDK